MYIILSILILSITNKTHAEVKSPPPPRKLGDELKLDLVQQWGITSVQQ